MHDEFYVDIVKTVIDLISLYIWLLLWHLFISAEVLWISVRWHSWFSICLLYANWLFWKKNSLVLLPLQSVDTDVQLGHQHLYLGEWLSLYRSKLLPIDLCSFQYSFWMMALQNLQEWNVIWLGKATQIFKNL